MCKSEKNNTATAEQLEQSSYHEDYGKAYRAAIEYGKFDERLGSRLDMWTLAGLTGVHESICRDALHDYYLLSWWQRNRGVK